MSATRRSTRWREGLVIAEVALACVLLVFGGLLLKSFQRVLDVDLGFQPAGAYAWQINTPQNLDSLAEVNAFYDRALTAVTAIPGVEAVGLTDALPLGRNRSWAVRAPGVEYQDGEEWTVVFPHLIDSRYLQSMQIPLLAGRYFSAHDDGDQERVVMLNQTGAKRVFGGQRALDQIMVINGAEHRVVGLVADVRHRSLELGAGSEMYLPVTQNGDFQTLDMVVRSRLAATALVPSVAAAISRLDPTLPTGEYQSLDGVVERSMSPRRFTLQLLIAFAATALLLAALGIYGVLSYSVNERLPEIGIRMALGESAAGVLRRIVGRTLLLAGCGLALGSVGALVVSRSVESLLYGVEPTDPMIFLAMAVLLLGVAALAGLGPALKAASTDTVEALRAS